jgi:DNA-binding LacI/PurR family transcriptional regulator
MPIKHKSKSAAMEESICRLILKEGLSPGDAILSEARAMELFSVSRITVRRAFAAMEEKGILRREKGRGTFLSSLPDFEMAGDENQSAASGMIGMVCHKIEGNYFSSLAQGVEDAASEAGFNVCFSCTKGYASAEERIFGDMRRHGVKGFIVSPTESNPPNQSLVRLCKSGEKVVIVNECIPGIETDTVSSDDREGGFLATRRLIEAGHRRIAHIRGGINVAAAADRFYGYQMALDCHGIPFDPLLVKSGPITDAEDSGRLFMLELLELPADTRPTAVFVYNEGMAVGALRAMEEKNLKVPDDMSVVSYGNSLNPLWAGQYITTVDQRPHEIGMAAGKMLMEKIMGSETLRRAGGKLLLSPRIIEKGSVASPKSITA